MQNKYARCEPGQIIWDLSGTQFRVISKVVGPTGVIVKFGTLLGHPVSPSTEIIPVSMAMARFAASMRYHLAYDRNIDHYIRGFCHHAGLPTPLGPDGQPFRWADWFANSITPKLLNVSSNAADNEAIKDEAVLDSISVTFLDRDVLTNFSKKIKTFHSDIQNLEKAKQLTVFLCKTLAWRVEEMNSKLRQQWINNPETSMLQPGNQDDESSEVNLLDTEEYANRPQEIAYAEAEPDIEKFKVGFKHWLLKKQTPPAVENYIRLFDMYWDWIKQSGGDEQIKIDEKQPHHRIKHPGWMPTSGDLVSDWTGNRANLGFYLKNFSALLQDYISEDRERLGEENIFVKLMDRIAREQAGELSGRRKEEQRIKERNDERSRLRKQKATASLKSARMVSGLDLTPEMEKQVLDKFTARWTRDNPKRSEFFPPCEQCDINAPFDGGDATGHNHPTIPLVSDEEWLRSHSFHFTNDGRLFPRSSAEPSFLGTKSSADKQAYDPGKMVYLYRGSLLCETCGLKARQQLAKSKSLPMNPEDEDSYDSDDYPKGPYGEGGGEADNPQYCGDCRVFLENPLTTDGYRLVNEQIAKAESMGRGNNPFVEEWKAFYPERESDEYTPEDAIQDSLNSVGEQGVIDEYDEQFKTQMGIRGADESSQQLPCCGGWHKRHKSDCPVYDKKFNEAIERLQAVPKRSSEPLMQLRDDITPGDTGRLPHAYKEGTEKTAGMWAVALRDQRGKTRTVNVKGMNYKGAQRAAQHQMQPGEQIMFITIASAKQADTAPAPVQPATVPTQSADLPVPSGTLTPQEMQQQNVSKAQGMPVQPPTQPQGQEQPSVAISPQNNPGDMNDPNTPMKHTVPPDLPNQRYHMSSEETPSPEMKEKVEVLAQVDPDTETHKHTEPYFDHGEWWVICKCHAIWLVVPGEIDGLGLEKQEEGDGSCGLMDTKLGTMDSTSVLVNRKKYNEAIRDHHRIL